MILRQKAKATTLDTIQSAGVHITGYKQNQFILSNGQIHHGPIAIYRSTVMSWLAHEFNASHMTLWTSLKPRLLILGTGNDTLRLPSDIKTTLDKHQLPFETMATRHAISTFENRNVQLYPSQFFIV